MIQVVNRTIGGEVANAYIVGDEGQDCFIVDDGYDKNGFLTGYALKHHPRILGILLTHGHVDHIEGLGDLGDKSIPLFIGAEDEVCLSDPAYNVSDLFGKNFVYEGEAYPLEDEDEIKLGQYIIKVIATPYHTQGGVCFYLKEHGILFSGDSLFQYGIGRYDLKGSCPRFLSSSLDKLMALPDETVVYPGHGKKTTIGTERAFLKASGYLR